jgi:hypothetical protein
MAQPSNSFNHDREKSGHGAKCNSTVAKGISYASHRKEINITMNLLKHLYT